MRRSRARRPYRWSDEALEAELRAFCDGRSVFPTATDFDVAKRGDLRSAVNELGGSAYWARVVGLPLPPSRERYAYTTEDATRDAREVIAKVGRLPGEPTLRRLGYGRLATRVRQAGGSRDFVAQHALEAEEQGRAES